MYAPIDREEQGEGTPVVPIPVVDVLRLVQYLFDEHGVHVDRATRAQYWDHAHEYFSWGKGHPGVADKDRIALGLHGDECRYTQGSGCIEKVIVLSLNVIHWSPRTSRNSRFVVAAVREKECLGIKTMYPLLSYICWCLNQLWEGKKPMSGFRGMPLSQKVQGKIGESEFLCKGRHRFALTEVRGDWSFHVYIFNMRNRWTSISICWKCRAKGLRHENATLQDSYMDFSESATWIPSTVSHAEFLTTMVQGQVCHSFGDYVIMILIPNQNVFLQTMHGFARFQEYCYKNLHIEGLGFYHRSIGIAFVSSVPVHDHILGPIFGVIGFHYEMIQFCFAHNAYLGTFQRTNAGAMLLTVYM